MKKAYCLGTLLLCGLIISGCGSDTSKLEDKIDKISTKVSKLDKEIDKLSKTGIDISKSSSEKTYTKTKDSKEKSKESTTNDSKKEPLKDLFAKDAIAQDEHAKIQVTKVDFVESTSPVYESSGLVVVYYTLENLGTENIAPYLKTSSYIYVSEEDDVSDTRIQDNGLSGYDAFKKLYENSTLNIKPKAKIETASAYHIKNEDKNIKVQIGTYEFTSSGEESVAAKTFTPKEIKKAYKKNEKIKNDQDKD
ncbi:hypothetical protein [Candidatus Enterococcus mansonii]|uniref:DUF5067 domain-containing protein n=1 Tax=Candidatus Enterococcus mansonii TaxID=1834181 RepID=A0A242C675_9ENTE|nr:hypothetical protein [Enterococcus sp. 4G2_DIV0659]OTO05691.1 hypothetical protein A5880_002866 [Enterococcus sp. 4G2_DIV0659]